MNQKKTSKSNNGWTEERRKRQSELIRQWQPWTASTGAKTEAGKKIISRNAFKGGYWLQERELQKQINATLKAQKELIAQIKD